MGRATDRLLELLLVDVASELGHALGDGRIGEELARRHLPQDLKARLERRGALVADGFLRLRLAGFGDEPLEQLGRVPVQLGARLTISAMNG